MNKSILLLIIFCCMHNKIIYGDSNFFARCIRKFVDIMGDNLSSLNKQNWQKIADYCDGVATTTPSNDVFVDHNNNQKNILIGGVPDIITDLIEHIKNPAYFASFGVSCPKGVLLVGPPGSGKTHLARYIAQELQAGFFYISASEFIEMYVGVGAQRVRELFNKAHMFVKTHPDKKAIVFIDELDAVARKRDTHNLEHCQTINELLVQMDGFVSSEGIIVLAATNDSHSIDEAFKRGGRFDYIVEIPLPDVKKREELLRHYLSLGVDPTILDGDIPYTLIAQQTTGCSCADMKTVADSAKTHALRRKATKIEKDDLLYASQEIKTKKKW